MEISPDYEELFRILNESKIKYLVVGAYAVMFYSEPRFTKDLDIWVIPELNNPDRVYGALRQFGAPLRRVRPRDFQDKSMILQIGVAPVRVDVMMDVPAVSFETAWKNRKKARYGKTPIYILGIRELIRAKRKAGRLQDKLDLERLSEQVKKISPKGRKRVK